MPASGARDAIDAQAEREAAAIEWMEHELEIDTGRTVFEQMRAAPVVKDKRYPLAASLRVHDRINSTATVADLLRIGRRKFEICTPKDRARRQLRKVRRAAMLTELDAISDAWVPFNLALKLIDAKSRTLHRATMEGRIGKRVECGKVFVTVEGLRAYLKAKLAA